MSSLGSPSAFFLAGKKGYEVKRSLRFNDGDSAYLSRTPSSTSNRKTWTFSAWVKRGNITTGAFQTLFSANNSSNYGLYGTYIWFTTTDTLAISINSGIYYLQTNAVFRDVSAWYHVVINIDTTQATSINRMKIYVNGVQETSFATTTYPTQNLDSSVNLNQQHTIGGRRYTSIDNYFDGYIAEINFIDGFQYDPSYFGETNAITGQWNPKKYVGSYGTNGFYLNFLDNSGTSSTTLGKDSSGNGNNFTPNNFSVAAGAGNDSLEDTPTNNFATFNPLIQSVNTFSEGNLQVTMTSNAPPSFYSTIGVSSGKYYMEFLVKSVTNYPLGISGSTQESNYFSLGDQIAFWIDDLYTRVFRNGSNITSNSVVVGNFETGVEGSSTGWAVNDIAGLALDMDNKIIYLYKGSTQVGYVNFSTFNYSTVFFGGGNYINGNVYIGNFGQRPFTYTPPTGYKSLCSKNLPDPTIKLPNKHFDTLLWNGNSTKDTDISGLNFSPDWVWIKSRSHSVYAGSLKYNHVIWDTLRGVGLDTSASSSRKELTINESYVEGNATNLSNYYGHVSAFNSDGFELDHITGQPPLLTNMTGRTYVAWNWNAGDTDGKTYTVKVVSDSGNKYRFDNFGTSAVTLDLAEGGTYIFDQSDSSNAGHPLRFSTTSNGTHGGGTEYTTGVTTAGTPGQSGAYTQIVVAASAPTLYYYCSVHSGMGGQANTNSTLGSSNFDGSIQSTVKTNSTAGFSIVTYTGNGSDGATIGHGLGVKPDFIIIKKRANNSGGNTGNWIGQHKFLTNGVNATSTLFTLTSYSSSAIYFNLMNGQSNYGFDSQVNGINDTFVAYCFNEVARYSKFGKYTGNGSTNGTFVYTGFRPALVITKQSSGSGSWFIFDNKRNGYNETDPYVMANSSNAEASDLGWDLLSNGFKLRNSYGATNGSGNTYIYLAFAESPFKNARAR